MKTNRSLTTTIRESLSWLGVVLILSAYILNNTQLLSSHHYFYQILNIFGSIFLGYDAFKQKNYQPAVLNLIWLIVALLSILGLFT